MQNFCYKLARPYSYRAWRNLVKINKIHCRATFDVSGNAWSCDCTIFPFFEFVTETSSMSRKMDDMVCSSPNYLKGRKLVDLAADDLTCETQSHFFKTVEYHIIDITVIFLLIIFASFFFARSRADFEVFHARARKIFKRQEKILWLSIYLL